jgi:caa(3)-type oxidase subunit IV
MGAYTKGFWVAALLAVLTIAEYIFAAEVGVEQVKFAGLAGTGLVKAVLIIIYFMHISRAWGPMEDHS